MVQRYIQQGNPGDGIIGRTASLLDENSETFATLPWHFQAGFHIDHDDLVVLVPGYDNYPPAFKDGIPLLVACGIKHFEFINTNYEESHKIRESFFWSRADIRSKLEPFIHGGILQSTGNPSMKATGVSPLTILLKRFSDVESNKDVEFFYHLDDGPGYEVSSLSKEHIYVKSQRIK